MLLSHHLRGKGRSSKLVCFKTTNGTMFNETLSALWPDVEAIREQLYLLEKKKYYMSQYLEVQDCQSPAETFSRSMRGGVQSMGGWG